MDKRQARPGRKPKHLDSGAVGWRTRLNERMKALGMGPLDLAEAAGIAPTSIYAMLQRSEPGLGNFAKIAAAVGCTMDEIFTGEGQSDAFPAGQRDCKISVRGSLWQELVPPRKVHLPWPLPQTLTLAIVDEAVGAFGAGDLLVTRVIGDKRSIPLYRGRLSLVSSKDEARVVGNVMSVPGPGDRVMVFLTRPFPHGDAIELSPDWIAPVVSHISKPLLGG